MNRKFRTIVAAVLLVIMGAVMTSCSKPKVYVEPSTLKLRVGQSELLQASFSESSGSPLELLVKASWDSDAPEIATVNESGRVQAISPGKCKIEAKYKGKSDYCDVTVTE